MFETFEHTADIGLRVRADTLEQLFEDAARGLMALLVEEPDAVGADRSEHVRLQANRVDDLLFDWLDELLYLFSVRGFVATRYEIDVTERKLEATVRGGDFGNAEGRMEVKAVTYHGLKAERSDGGWLGEIILDI